MTVDTKHVENRREIKLQKIDDLKAEINRLGSADAQVVGNWSVSQIITHLTGVMKMAVTRDFGFRGSLPVRIMSRLFFKTKFLTKTIPSGFKIPGKAKKYFQPDPNITTGQAVAAFNEAYDIYIKSDFMGKHPFLGQLTREEWDQFQLRHAENHLSFIIDARSAV